MPRFTFKKEERLTGKKNFDLLFESGKSIAVYPFRLVWMEIKSNDSFPVQVGISVPKKSFPKAVDRNTIKRRIREAYRKNKHMVYGFLLRSPTPTAGPVGFSRAEERNNNNLDIALMIIYTAKEKLSYREIEKKMIVSLQKLRNEM